MSLDSRKPVLLMKGIWDSGKRTIEQFRDPLKQRGFSVADFHYPIHFLTRTWLMPHKDQALAAEISQLTQDQPHHVIAHSNGCRLATLAMKQGARFDRVIFLAPAWQHQAGFPQDSFSKLWVVHSRFDLTVAMGALLPKHSFGWLGVIGYHGPQDGRITNVDAGRTTHKGYFTKRAFPKWRDFALSQLNPREETN